MRCPRTALALSLATLAVAGAGPLTAQAQLFGKRAGGGKAPVAGTAQPAPPPSDYNPMLGSRGARKLMRNGLDYLNTYQDPERALLYFQQARARLQELDASEQKQLAEAIAQASQLVAARMAPARVAPAPAVAPAPSAVASRPAPIPSRAIPPMFAPEPEVQRTGAEVAELPAMPVTTAAAEPAMLPLPAAPALEPTMPPLPAPTATSAVADEPPAAMPPLPAAPAPAPEPLMPVGSPSPAPAPAPSLAAIDAGAPAPIPVPTDGVVQVKAQEPAPAAAAAAAATEADDATLGLTILDDPADHLDGLAEPGRRPAPAPVAASPAPAPAAMPAQAPAPVALPAAELPPPVALPAEAVEPPALGAPDLSATPAPVENLDATPEAIPDAAPEPGPAPTTVPPASEGVLLIPPPPRGAATAEAMPPLPTAEPVPVAVEPAPTRIASAAPAEPAAPAAVEVPTAELPATPAPTVDLSRVQNQPLPGRPATAVEPPLPPAAEELPTLPGRSAPTALAPTRAPRGEGLELRPDSLREVEEIALRQEAEQRANPRIYDSTGRNRQANTDLNPAAGRADVPRAPSPTEARPIKPIPVPEEFVPMEKRVFAPSRKYWAAPAVCHTPLYFQDAVLERYGQSVEQAAGPAGRYLSYPLDDPRESTQRMQLLQPFYSAGMFALQIAALPYNLLMDPPWEAQYDLGFHRPGDPIPPDSFYLPKTGLGPPLRGDRY